MAAKVDAAWPVKLLLSGTDSDGDSVRIEATLTKAGKLTVTSVEIPPPLLRSEP
jgi:hypothetical protein